MRNLITLPILALVLFAAGGCASYFTRKECEKTNWYQHGHDVAMSGKRLDADDFIKQCQKVEAKFSFSDADNGFKAGMAKYCTGDNVFNMGKAGKPFSYDMCDGENEKKMKAQWTSGVRQFCVAENGYHYGAAGSVYQSVCPKDLEAKWMIEYRRGRKVYLTAMIEEKTRESQRLDGEIRSLETQRMSLQMEKANVANRTVIRTEQIFDPKTRTYRQQVTQVPDESSKNRAQQIDSDIANLNYKIQSTRGRQDALNSEVSKMRAEVVAL